MTRRLDRTRLREARRALSPLEQHRASQSLLRQISSFLPFICADRIGFYLANDGEIDPTPLRKLAEARGKDCYLPVVSDKMMRWRKAPLVLQPYRTGDPLVQNRFGIPEPAFSFREVLPPRMLDILFVPLLGFDREGTRLGMGGGFYDRTLADRSRDFRRPLLVGLGYGFQEVDRLEAEPWDVALDVIATDAMLIQTGARNRTPAPAR